MSDELKNVLLQSNKIIDSEKWDAEYDSLPVVIAESPSLYLVAKRQTKQH